MPTARFSSALVSAVLLALLSVPSDPAAGMTAPSQSFIARMADNIRAQLGRTARGRHVVGYAFFLGEPATYGSGGLARTRADKRAVSFTRATKMTVASVSKVVTAIAVMRIFGRQSHRLDDSIGPYLPSDWSVSAYVKGITFAQLLSHTTGVQDYGDVNVLQQYEQLKTFFSQPVSIATYSCPGPGVRLMQSGITMNTQSCYSNYNFALFRILLPRVAGYREDPNPARRPKTLAAEYASLVQRNVFDRVGQRNVSCAPPTRGPGAWSYAFAYNFPGNQHGQDWGDQTDSCGAAGWYLSVEDIGKVFASLAADDGRILSHRELQIMEQQGFGWDLNISDEDEKNGGWSETAGSLTTSVAIFGPRVGPRFAAVLFLNSDVSGEVSCGADAQRVLENAYHALVPISPLFPKPTAVDWPDVAAAFPTGVNAGVVWPDGNTYFFKGDQFVGVNPSTGVGNGLGGQPTQSFWPGLAEAFPGGVDAGVVWPNGHAYFFKGTEYVDVDIATRTAGSAKPIQGNWPGLAEAFPAGIDSAVVWPNGYAYFFKGDQYVRYNMWPKTEGVEPGYPKPIAGNWPRLRQALPAGFDAAVVWGCDVADFFKGDQVWRYRISPVLQL